MPNVPPLDILAASVEYETREVKIATGDGYRRVRRKFPTGEIATHKGRIDWDKQGSIPAGHIDWSGVGEPLLVRSSWRFHAMLIAAMVSIVSGVAFFVYEVRDHIADRGVHANVQQLQREIRDAKIGAKDFQIEILKLLNARKDGQQNGK